ncbi:MAG: hypothetical protein H7835_12635 [Magnetococcus sp. XQGC-1]
MKLWQSLKVRSRPWSSVPLAVYLLAVVALGWQLFWHFQQVRPSAQAVHLPTAPAEGVLRVLAFGEPVSLAKVVMLWLQAFDYQSGVSLAFRDLDPIKLELWLRSILHLDPRGQYPLLAASRLYADIPRETTQRILSDLVYQAFFVDPDRRWPWLGHVAIIAKHRLHDLPLALKYARAINRYATGAGVPRWAREMELVFLEDMGELENARIFIGGLLLSGQVTSPREIHFLNERLRLLEAKME